MNQQSLTQIIQKLDEELSRLDLKSANVLIQAEAASILL